MAERLKFECDRCKVKSGVVGSLPDSWQGVARAKDAGLLHLCPDCKGDFVLFLAWKAVQAEPGHGAPT